MVENIESNGQKWVRDVVSRYEGPLLRYARRVTACPELAREAVHETFMRCWGEQRWRVNGCATGGSPASANVDEVSRVDGRPPGPLADEPPVAHAEHLANWLFSVCRSRAIDALRKERQMTRIAELEATDGWAVACIDPRPAEVAEARDSAAAAMRALESLPVRQQEVVALKFQAGMSYAQIAEVTGLSVSNVGFLMHVALKSMRQRLKDCLGG